MTRSALVRLNVLATNLTNEGALADAHAGTSQAGHSLYLAAWLSLRHNLPDAEAQMRAFVDHRDARRVPDLVGPVG